MRFALTLGLAAATILGSCGRGAPGVPDAAPAGSAAPAVAAGAPDASELAPTNDGVNAANGLDGEIEMLEARLAGAPDWLLAGPTLIARLETRAAARSSAADRARALTLADAWLKDSPGEPRALAARGAARAAVHLYVLALADLDAAAAKGADVRVARASILLALGRWPEVEAILAKADGKVPGLDVVQAGLLAEQGKLDEADVIFRRAAKTLRTTSPHGLASILFQHGVVLEQGGRPAQAKARYQLALARLPGFVPGIVHLAGIAIAEKDAARAEALTAAVGTSSDDPEVLAVRAEALRALGRATDAAPLIDQARARIEAAVAAQPEATAAHAARFYAGIGEDPAKALAHARRAWTSTRAPEAAALVLRIALDQADVATACKLLAESAALPDAVSLRVARERARAACPAPKTKAQAKPKK